MHRAADQPSPTPASFHGVRSSEVTRVTDPKQDSGIHEEVEEILPPSRRQNLFAFARRVTGLQFVRYVMVGMWNTALGYAMFAGFTYLFRNFKVHIAGGVSIHGYIFASMLSNAIGITVAFFGYKLIVFRTKGNYLKEYIRCCIVYGSAAIPGLFLLPIIKNGIVYATSTRFNTITFNGHIFNMQQLSPYLAGAIVTCGTIMYSFIGHRKFSFRHHKHSQPEPTV
jgi:putative flippase GtrA